MSFYKRISTALLITIGASFTQCSDKHAPSEPNVKLLGEQHFASLAIFQNTVVGGISGIDMDPNGKFYLISDDADFSSPRFYTAALDYDLTGFRSVTLQSVVSLKKPTGSLFPSFQSFISSNGSGGEFSDSESIRFNSTTGTLFWTSEGTYTPPVIAQPFVRQMNLSGDYISEVSTPALFRYTPTPANTGLIDNATFEAMSLIPGTDELWVAIEAPLLQDGPRPTYFTHGSAIRIARINWKTNTQIAQYAYVPEQNPLKPSANGTNNNGIPEVLAIDGSRLLVLERAFSAGYDISKGNTIRIYQVDFTNATDVSGMNSLAGQNYVAAKKTLLYDFSQSGLSKVDNFEAMCWGKDLSNGHKALVLVTDDNFSSTQTYQYVVLEVVKLFD